MWVRTSLATAGPWTKWALKVPLTQTLLRNTRQKLKLLSPAPGSSPSSSSSAGFPSACRGVFFFTHFKYVFMLLIRYLNMFYGRGATRFTDSLSFIFPPPPCRVLTASRRPGGGEGPLCGQGVPAVGPPPRCRAIPDVLLLLLPALGMPCPACGDGQRRLVTGAVATVGTARCNRFGVREGKTPPRHLHQSLE